MCLPVVLPTLSCGAMVSRTTLGPAPCVPLEGANSLWLLLSRNGGVGLLCLCCWWAKQRQERGHCTAVQGGRCHLPVPPGRFSCVLPLGQCVPTAGTSLCHNTGGWGRALEGRLGSWSTQAWLSVHRNRHQETAMQRRINSSASNK